MPLQWHERMKTIVNYEQDSSAMGRLNAWAYSINIANDRIVGGGFESWSLNTFQIYAPDPNDMHAAHSIYFGILGDHGWFGLVMFLLILILTWITLSTIIKHTKHQQDVEWAAMLSRMIQVSFIAYMSGGAFLSLSYFDLPWHLIAITVICRELIMKTQQQENTKQQMNAVFS